MRPEELLALFGTDNVDEIYRRKEKEKQVKVFTGKRPSAITMTPEECKKLCDKAGFEYLTGYEGRVLQYAITNETTDRYGDIVRAKGAKFDNYMKNPVIMLFHDYKQFPVGNTIKVWKDSASKSIPAWGLFTDERVDSSGRASLAYKFGASGLMRACSIGFNPIKMNRPASPEEREKMGLGMYGVEHSEWDLMEWSPCGVPANPDALQNDITAGMLSLKGIFAKEDFDLAANLKFFADANLLDMFAEAWKKAEGGSGVRFTIDLGTSEGLVIKEGAGEPAPVVTADPEVPAVDPIVAALEKFAEITNKLEVTLSKISEAADSMSVALASMIAKLAEVPPPASEPSSGTASKGSEITLYPMEPKI